jgi:hypothetical protein
MQTVRRMKSFLVLKPMRRLAERKEYHDTTNQEGSAERNQQDNDNRSHGTGNITRPNTAGKSRPQQTTRVPPAPVAFAVATCSDRLSLVD